MVKIRRASGYRPQLLMSYHSPYFHGNFQEKAAGKRMHSPTLQTRAALKRFRGTSKYDAICKVMEAEVVQGDETSNRFGMSASGVKFTH